MRRSKVLAKLRAGEPLRITSLGHCIPAFVRFAAHYGFDAIWLDLEHRPWEEREIQSLLPVFHLYDIDCILRAPTLEKTRLYRYLEDGASGLMIPHVSTAEKAKMLVDATKFPPVGDRGLDGAGLDGDFYIHGEENYVEHARHETFLIVQIETPEAIRNVYDIAAVEGVDGMFIGPGDLSLRIRESSDVDYTLDEAIQQVASAAAKHRKAWGIPAATAEQLRHYRQLGASILAHGGDFFAFARMLEATAKAYDEAYS